MTLQELVEERIRVDCSLNQKEIKKWSITSEEDLVYLQMLALIPDKDKEDLRQKLLKERKVVEETDRTKDEQSVELRTVKINSLSAEIE